MTKENLADPNAEELEELLRSSTGPVLVDFWADWCAPCHALHPILAEVARELGNSARICRVDTLEYPELSDRFEIRSIPTMVIFEGGLEVKRLLGLKNKRQIVRALTESVPDA